MSVILDALKKAEKDKLSTTQKIEMGENSSPYTIEKLPQKSKPLVILAVLVIIGGGAFLGFKHASVFKFQSLTNLYSKLPKQTQGPTQPLPTPQPETPPASVEDASALRKEAFTLFNDARWDDSRKKWERLTEINPQDAEAFNNLGVTFKKMGDVDAAELAYQKALRANPDYPEALNNIAVVLLGRGESGLAGQFLSKAIELDPNYAAPYLYLGMVAEEKGDIPKAIESFENFLLHSTQVSEEIRIKIEMKMALLKAPR